MRGARAGSGLLTSHGRQWTKSPRNHRLTCASGSRHYSRVCMNAARGKAGGPSDWRLPTLRGGPMQDTAGRYSRCQGYGRRTTAVGAAESRGGRANRPSLWADVGRVSLVPVRCESGLAGWVHTGNWKQPTWTMWRASAGIASSSSWRNARSSTWHGTPHNLDEGGPFQLVGG